MKANDFIVTYSGKKVRPFAAKPSDFDLESVAHSLSTMNRFTGHARIPLSVAQHSVNVSKWVAAEAKRLGLPPAEVRMLSIEALCHDVEESVIADISSPVKYDHRLTGYREVASNLRPVIAKRFGFRSEESPLVKRGDLVMLATEARDLMPKLSGVKYGPEKPIKTKIKPWPWRTAKRRFIEEARKLGVK